MLWWSPDPREVLLPHEFHRSRSLARSLRARGFEWRQDRDFAAVVAACAAPRIAQPRHLDYRRDAGGLLRACIERGLAHSYEIWRDDHLVGGVYGVRLGRVFFGESMFSRERDASKAALAGLVERCSAARHRADRLPAALCPSAQPGQPRHAAAAVPALSAGRLDVSAPCDAPCQRQGAHCIARPLYA